MRTGIHPDYVECKVHCSCGVEFVTRSTKPELHIELCSQCHPFYTGKQKFVDTGGRVQRFSDKFGGAAETVMAKDAAAKEARQKAHEEAVTAAREVRLAKEAAEAASARELERRTAKTAVAEASIAEAAAEAPAEYEAEAVAETADEPVAETADEIAAETADEPAAETADEPAAEEPAE